jgi:hypothetical protein
LRSPDVRVPLRDDEGVRISAFRGGWALVLLVALTTSCTGEGPATGSVGGSLASGVDPASLAGELGSSDLYVGSPQRVNVGLFSSTLDGGVRLVTHGQVEVTFAPYGGGPGTQVTTTARYIPAPGTPSTGPGPVLSAPSDSRGVYEATGVTFDAAGIWQATATFSVDGEGPFTVQVTPFQVQRHPQLPAPGDDALVTRNLTFGSDAPREALDSRALGGEPIPDPELHRHTIAGSLHDRHAVLAIFSTPVYCVSLFCGPVTDAVQKLAAEYPTKADFIHVEIYREVTPDKRVVNQAAADWLYRNGDLVEPWLYLIDAEGVIIDRWSPLFDPQEVGDLLAAMPDMRS